MHTNSTKTEADAQLQHNPIESKLTDLEISAVRELLVNEQLRKEVAAHLTEMLVNLPFDNSSPLYLLPHTIDDRGGTQGSAEMIEAQLISALQKISAAQKLEFVEPTVWQSIPFDPGPEGDHPGAKHLPAIVEYTRWAMARCKTACLCAAGTVGRVFSYGGNHTRATELLGFIETCNLLDKTPVVFWIDAHLDLNNDKTSVTENVHGQVADLLLGKGAKQLLVSNCINYL